MDNSNHPDIGPADVAKDLLRIGPAPSRPRETIVTVVNVVLVIAVIAVLQPEPAVTAAFVAIAAAFTVIRWAVGLRRWSR